MSGTFDGRLKREVVDALSSHYQVYTLTKRSF
jgi:hypothetical protein